MRQTLAGEDSARVALALVACMTACNRGPGLTAEDAGAPAARSAHAVVDASAAHPATLAPPPAPAHGEFSAYLAATSGHAITLKLLGEQVLVVASGGPYEVRHDGEIVKSALGAKLTAHSPGDIAGKWPDDLWAIDAEESRGERTHVFYFVSHWENGAWAHVDVKTELSDMAGDWFDGFTPTSPRTALALTHNRMEVDGGEPDDDVITTITPDGGSVARGVGSVIGSDGVETGGQLLGTASGDAFIATGDHVIRIPPGGREVVIPAPWGATSDVDAGTADGGNPSGPDVEATAMAPVGNGSVVVAFHLGKAASAKPAQADGRSSEKTAIAVLKGQAKWETYDCPFDEPVASIVATPDGAFWIVTKASHVWRYHHGWKELEILPSDLQEANLTKSPDVALVATTADDAWLSFNRGSLGALFHTKPPKEVRRFGAPPKKPTPAKAP